MRGDFTNGGKPKARVACSEVRRKAVGAADSLRGAALVGEAVGTEKRFAGSVGVAEFVGGDDWTIDPHGVLPVRFLFVVVASNRERPFVRRTFCKRPAIALYLCGNCFRDLMGKRMKYAVWAAVAMIFALHAACLQPSRSRLLPCAGPVETIAAAGTLDELHELIVSAWACDLVPAVCGSNSVQVHIPVLRLPSHGRDGWQCPVSERPAEEGRSEILFAVQRVCCERFCASLGASGILCPGLAENHYLAGSSFRRAGRVSDAVPCRRHGRTFPGSPCRNVVWVRSRIVRVCGPGLPGMYL